MVLYLIGLGLGDHKDITLRGMECIKNSVAIYLEYYTSILGIDNAELEAFYGKPVILADREYVESRAEEIYGRAKEENVSLLVVGDPLAATTHVDILLRCRKENIPYEVIHNASVMNAVASCGLPLYQFGYSVSIPLFEGEWRPSSFYERIAYNNKGGMHTLCLLDIKVKEPDYSAMTKHGKMRFLPPRFMTINQAIDQMLSVEEEKQEGVVTKDTLGVAVCRLGQKSQLIAFGRLEELQNRDFGGPLHALVLCGEIHPLEREYLEYLHVDRLEPAVPFLDRSESAVYEEPEEAVVEGL